MIYHAPPKKEKERIAVSLSLLQSGEAMVNAPEARGFPSRRNLRTPFLRRAEKGHSTELAALGRHVLLFRFSQERPFQPPDSRKKTARCCFSVYIQKIYFWRQHPARRVTLSSEPLTCPRRTRANRKASPSLFDERWKKKPLVRRRTRRAGDRLCPWEGVGRA